MNQIERIYRMRRSLLVCALVCSGVLFLVLCFPKPFGSLEAYPWRLFDNPLKLLLEIAAALAVLLLLFLFVRYIAYRASTLENPVLREAVDDERIRVHWLRAYRAAFFVMAAIHLVYLFAEGLMYEAGFPHAAWASSSAGLTAFFGSALYYTREAKNERS
jgi:uncharacterized membrane protein YjgN (DUF898 family)